MPDIEFDFIGQRWLLSVKIGENPATRLSAFLQYLRHKQESGIEYGQLLILPESVRRTAASEEAVYNALLKTNVSVLVDAQTVKDEYRDRPFPAVLDTIQAEVRPLIQAKAPRYYPLPLVIELLRAQVAEVMASIDLGETQILKIITDRNLLTDLARLPDTKVEGVTRFLAAYIILSQILFLRIFTTAHPEIKPPRTPVDASRLRRAFQRILQINYREIFELDVLEAVPADYLRDVFDLIWGLEVEKVRYELPGRVFHALMPHEIRKLLAAFYTRPQAAEILANLTIEESDADVYDPACGSGTILVSAYRRKRELFGAERRVGNPHKRFCENDIFGSDIMPFAVHLTSANISAMDVAETLEHTLIVHGDGLTLTPGHDEQSGLQQFGLFPATAQGRRTAGDAYTVPLRRVRTVLMNPPFTKTERGIAKYVDMRRFQPRAGGEVGLWGHFIMLANEFLRRDGVYGAVIPINILRGRESESVRDFLFSEWTPLYVLKPTLNYGFSEWAEYRDVIVVARKSAPPDDHSVKFCLVKHDLTQISDTEIDALCETIKSEDEIRSETVDIDSHPLNDVLDRRANMMWFCGVSDFRHRDTIVNFVSKFNNVLTSLDRAYFREGYRPVPKGVSHFLFFTRALNAARVSQAFLRFDREYDGYINASTDMGVTFRVDLDEVRPTLRTPVGLETMDISDKFDYIASGQFEELSRVKRACGFEGRIPHAFWNNLERELNAVETNIVVSRRVNPYSPNTNLFAFVSDTPISPSNQVNVVRESDLAVGRAIVTIINSAIFLSQFFLLKEESTGRYIDIRFYDMEEMLLKPSRRAIERLQSVYETFSNEMFPSLRNQLDAHFESRYDEFWEVRNQTSQQRLWSALGEEIRPADIRLNFDKEVCRALGVRVTKPELINLYRAIVNEMIITRHLTSD
ncbi:MAG: SAM-dependent methyltransferase [Acidobacteriota bacterium]|nr:SAM-dependent methyltransferase [Acidobacteriota bacterium]